jgi:hypothetical protein
VGDKVPSPYFSARGAQLNRWAEGFETSLLLPSGIRWNSRKSKMPMQCLRLCGGRSDMSESFRTAQLLGALRL